MNARQFFNLVSQMRATQKEYFRTRSKEVLLQSKRVEKRVDDEIIRVYNILNKQEPTAQ